MLRLYAATRACRRATTSAGGCMVFRPVPAAAGLRHGRGALGGRHAAAVARSPRLGGPMHAAGSGGAGRRGLGRGSAAAQRSMGPLSAAVPRLTCASSGWARREARQALLRRASSQALAWLRCSPRSCTARSAAWPCCAPVGAPPLSAWFPAGGRPRQPPSLGRRRGPRSRPPPSASSVASASAAPGGSRPWLLAQDAPRRWRWWASRRHHGGVYLLESFAGEERTGPLNPAPSPPSMAPPPFPSQVLSP